MLAKLAEDQARKEERKALQKAKEKEQRVKGQHCKADGVVHAAPIHVCERKEVGALKRLIH